MDEKEARQADKLARKAAAAQEKADLKQAKVTAKNEKLANKAAEERANLEKFGKQVAVETIQSGLWLANISIYDKGYVKVSGRYEKVRGISGDVQVSKKTGIGRGAVAIATFGVNLAVANSQRGRIHLTIVTDSQTHVFSTDQVSDSAIKSYQNLLATGTAIMEMLKQQANLPVSTSPNNESVTEKIKQLSEFHAQGILSEAEFTAAKAKLLGLS
jgi:hypothetical protein